MPAGNRSSRGRSPKLAETDEKVEVPGGPSRESGLGELGSDSELSEVDDDGEPPKPVPIAIVKTTRITRSGAALLSRMQSTANGSSTAKKRARPASATTTTTTTTTRKRAKPGPGPKPSARYAQPSKYAHLGGVTDAFTPNLISVFIGLNPGIATATAGHAYASPSNHFWRFLHSSGLTPDRQCPPETDVHLPRLYSLGNTNLVARATKEQAELSKEEMDDNVEVCEQKMRMWRPESVCVVGKGIWESIWRAKHAGRKIAKGEFVWGWQVDEERFGAVPEEGYAGARVFVVPSTSGLVAGYSMEFKKATWKVLGDWVQQRRVERGETAPRTDVPEVDGV